MPVLSKEAEEGRGSPGIFDAHRSRIKRRRPQKTPCSNWRRGVEGYSYAGAGAIWHVVPW